MASRAVAWIAVIVSATGIVLATAGAASAQPTKTPEDPGVLARQAEERAGAGDYVGAAAKFLAAYKLDPRPEYLCNVGVAYQRAQIWARAHAFLGDCIVKGSALDPEFVELVKQALTDVEATLRAGNYAPIEVAVAPVDAAVSYSTFGESEKLPGSRTVWMPAGRHSITVEATGYETAVREVVIAERTGQRVPVALVKQGAPRDEPFAAERADDRSMVPAIVASSVTVAVGAAAVVTYLKARSIARDAGDTDITRDEYDDRIADARQWKHISWGLSGAAALGAGISGFLWYRYASAPSTLEVAPTTGGAAVSFSTRW